MAITLIVFLVFSAVSAAPPATDGAYRDWQKELLDKMELNKLPDVYPVKRSNYGYVSPCAAAAAASVPMSYHPAMTAPIPGYASAVATMPYQHGHASYQPVPPQYGHATHYSQPYYRMEDENGNEQEIMGFSDMDHVASDHMPLARYSYAAAPAAVVGSTGSGPATASGHVVGVFSNANVGGCSVPLLVSCSPSIIPGRMVKSQYYDNTGPGAQQGNLYRAVEEHPQHEEPKGHHASLAPSSEHTSHNSQKTEDNHQ